ncbi:MAG TPA: hypothetical protein VJ022_08205 [Anaerolineales bacterium]|nr:hypothetical protein [Anaerolineales bacterium]
MFLMWIVPLLLIGFAVDAISGNNPATVLRSVANRTCPHCGQTL